MTNAQLLGDFSIDNYQLYSLGHYPGAVPGNGTVHGEVYRIDNATLAELDALRTRGGEYARQLIQTPYGSAWMYVYQRPVDGLKLIESGSERKAKDGKVTKKNREIHRIKQRHPKVACFYYYLSLSNQSPLSISIIILIHASCCLYH